MRYHTSTEALIQTAARKARDLGHSYVGSVHLLLALTLEAGDMGLVCSAGVEPELTEARRCFCTCRNSGSALPRAHGGSQESSADAAREARQCKCRRFSRSIWACHARRERRSRGAAQGQRVSPDTLFTHTVDICSGRQTAPKGKKEAVTLRLLSRSAKIVPKHSYAGHRAEKEIDMGWASVPKCKNNPRWWEAGGGKDRHCRGLAQRWPWATCRLS